MTWSWRQSAGEAETKAGDWRVVFVVFDGVKMLDVAGPAEVLADANLFDAGHAVSYALAWIR